MTTSEIIAALRADPFLSASAEDEIQEAEDAVNAALVKLHGHRAELRKLRSADLDFWRAGGQELDNRLTGAIDRVGRLLREIDRTQMLRAEWEEALGRVETNLARDGG